MTINDLFKPDNQLQKEMLLIVFMRILLKELHEFLMTWNSRNVRQSAAAPGGVLDIIFSYDWYTGFSKSMNRCRKS